MILDLKDAHTREHSNETCGVTLGQLYAIREQARKELDNALEGGVSHGHTVELARRLRESEKTIVIRKQLQ